MDPRSRLASGRSRRLGWLAPHAPGERLVSFPVSFAYVRNRSARTAEDGQLRSQTVMTYAGPYRADLESVWGSSRSRPARERPSDKVSDNRHGQRWTPADAHGRSVPGQGCCGAGSPRLYLASGRRGRRFKSGHPDPRNRRVTWYPVACGLLWLSFDVRCWVPAARAI
jgi:hypothetical protein